MTTDQDIIAEWDRIEKTRGPILAGDTEAAFRTVARNLGIAPIDVQAAMHWKWLAPT